jgi:hypothetical protein
MRFQSGVHLGLCFAAPAGLRLDHSIPINASFFNFPAFSGKYLCPVSARNERNFVSSVVVREGLDNFVAYHQMQYYRFAGLKPPAHDMKALRAGHISSRVGFSRLSLS